MKADLILILSLAALGSCKTAPVPSSQTPSPIGPKEAALMNWNGPFSSVSEPAVRIVKTADEWQALWRDIGAPEAPIADLQTYIGAAVFLGQRNTGGYSVKLLDSVVENGKVIVRYRESVPRGITFQALTYPYAVRLYPKTGADIVVEAEKKDQ
jgi:hypothetical protein